MVIDRVVLFQGGRGLHRVDKWTDGNTLVQAFVCGQHSGEAQDKVAPQGKADQKIARVGKTPEDCTKPACHLGQSGGIEQFPVEMMGLSMITKVQPENRVAMVVEDTRCRENISRI